MSDFEQPRTRDAKIGCKILCHKFLRSCRQHSLAEAPEECAWIQDDLGFDRAINYRTKDVPKTFAAACPDGIDIYFDNVGGEILDACLKLMNFKGRIPTCGVISQYNAPAPVPAGPYSYAMILMQRLRVEGFIVLDFAERYPEAIAALGQYMAESKIKVRTEVVDGLENALQTVKKLYTGANTGKLMIRVKDVLRPNRTLAVTHHGREHALPSPKANKSSKTLVLYRKRASEIASRAARRPPQARF